ncbi:unnamed protein product [Ectocarpus fasciculatus]
MLPAFNIKLGHQVQTNLVTLGKFNGSTPSLACGTTGGKVLLHSPHEQHGPQNGQLPAIRFLNFNRKITALTAGVENGKDTRDTLFVGTQSNLVAYDVERNAEIFFKDIQDGVNALHVGKMSNLSSPLVIVGGNCSILGYDKEGSEVFWTVTGDNVSALTMSGVATGHSSATKELLVGSDDFEIRVFQNEDLVSEITEADKVIFLHPMENCKFAYGLSNGTVGVYNASKQRMWRVKAKNNVTALQTYDLDMDGVDEVVSGWSNGSFNVRRDHSGEIIFKDTMKSPVAGLVCSDYRLDGKECLMVVAESGDVRAYLATDMDLTLATENAAGAAVTNSSGEQKALADLHQKKQKLIGELRTLEKSLKSQKTGTSIAGSLPYNTSLNYRLEADAAAGTVIVFVEATTDVQVHTLLAFDTEGSFLSGNEVVVAIPPSSSRAGSISITPNKNVACQLKVQAHLSVRGHSDLLHVYEKTIQIPHFAGFQNMPDKSSCPLPSSEILFEVSSKISKVEEWIRASFLIDHSTKLTNGDKLRAYFISIFDVTRNGQETGQRSSLFISAHSSGNKTEIVFNLDGMELAGNLIQDLSKYLNITELDSVSKFPYETAEVSDLVRQVSEYNISRNRLQADMADDSQRVKALIVRAEDSRLMVDMESMRRAYTELYGLNNQLIAGYSTRAANHEGLMAGLKQINQVIQRASNLRVGTAKTQVVSACRAAVKANNLDTLVNIICGTKND